MVVEQTNFGGPNGLSYYDIGTGKVVKGGKKMKGQIQMEKMDDFWKTIEPESQYIWGKRNFPTPAEMLMEGVDFTGDYKKKVNREIKDNNRMVERRAKILTYASNVLGKEIPIRTQMSGFGGGGKVLSTIAAPAVTTEIPPWFSLIPEGLDLPNKNSQIGHMSKYELAEYVSRGNYIKDLGSGRLMQDADQIEYLSNILKTYHDSKKIHISSDSPEENNSFPEPTNDSVELDDPNEQIPIRSDVPSDDFSEPTNGFQRIWMFLKELPIHSQNGNTENQELIKYSNLLQKGKVLNKHN